MANNYTGFSFVAATKINDTERAWWERYTDYDQIEKAGFPAPFRDEYVSFKADIGTDVIIYFEESGDPDQVADLCQLFLKTFRPQESIVFSWAYWCDKARTDNFGGGAVAITHNKQHWFNPENMADKFLAGATSIKDVIFTQG
jgi:hypothetical protein